MQRWTRKGFLLGASVAVSLSTAAQGQCDSGWLPGLGLNGTDSSINSLIIWDPDGVGPEPELLVGSAFTAGATVLGGFGGWDGTAWRKLGGGMGVALEARAVFRGQIAAAHSYTLPNGGRYHGVTSWDGSAWKPLGGRFNGEVRALAVYHDRLIAGGMFTGVDGVYKPYVAAWDGDSWDFVSEVQSTPRGGVQALAVDGDTLIAAGSFTGAGEIAAQNIARWNGSAWSAIGNGLEMPVSRLTVRAGQIYVDGFAPPSVVRMFHWNGSSWRRLGEVGEGYVNTMLAVDGGLIAGGSFQFIDGVPFAGLAKWDGNEWHAMGGVPPGAAVYALAVFQGELYAAGDFDAVGGRFASNIARYDGAAWHALTEGLGSDGVAATAEYDGDVVVLSRGGRAGNRVLRWDGIEWTYIPGVLGGHPTNGSLAAVEYDDGLVVGGFFREVSGQVVNSIARWDGSAWHDLAGGMGAIEGGQPSIQALEVFNGDLIAAGTFISAGGQPIAHIARWDGSGWHSLGGGLNSGVGSLAVYRGELIAGGDFSRADGVLVNGVAAWNGESWRPLGAGVFGAAQRLVVYNDELHALGVRPPLRWNGVEWRGYPPFDFGAYIIGAGVYRDQLVVAYQFFNQPARFVEWDGSAWTPLAIEFAPEFRADAGGRMREHHGELWMVGRFATSTEDASVGVGRWTDHAVPWIARQPVDAFASCSDTIPASFNVTVATGYEDANYQWRREWPVGSGVFVPLSDGPTGSGSEISGGATSTLTIRHAALADIGLYDCVVSGPCGSSISAPALLEPCIADLVCDGVVDFTDYLEFLNLFVAQDPRADIDGDGVVDFADYLTYLNAFDAGC